MDYKFGFVVLHYMGMEDTVECVNSILEIEIVNCEIIIVDNASTNRTGKKLEDKFSNNNHIHVILNENNLGFANGNNVGYKFAKEYLHCDYIACINSDTIIKQKEFCEVVEKTYQKYKCEIIGPDIISIRDGQHQNPLSYQQKPYRVRKLICTCIHLFLLYFRDFFPRFSEPKMNAFNEKNNILTLHCKLMGAAIIFTPSYLSKYDYAFDSRTFMYCEEDFLSYLTQRDRLLTVYQPNAVIFHKEFSSTSIKFKGKNRKRLRFKWKQMFLSYIKLIILIINDRRKLD